MDACRWSTSGDPGREMFRILGLIVLMAALYGIAHDQITARIYPAYFNVDHPDLGYPAIFHSSNPIILAFAWGIVATVPLATVLGAMIAIVAQAGGGPRISARDLFKPLLLIFCIMALMAVAGGIWGYPNFPLVFQKSLKKRGFRENCSKYYCNNNFI